MKTQGTQTIGMALLLVGLFTVSALAEPSVAQEYKKYVVSSGELVEKSKVKELRGVVRQTKLWITGPDRQTHPACVIQLADSSEGVFVMDYRPAVAIGTTVRISVVRTTPVAHPATDVRGAGSNLDKCINVNRPAKCYATVRDATPIDYKLARKDADSASK